MCCLLVTLDPRWHLCPQTLESTVKHTGKDVTVHVEKETRQVHMMMQLDLLSFLEGRKIGHGVVYYPFSDFGDYKVKEAVISVSLHKNINT